MRGPRAPNVPRNMHDVPTAAPLVRMLRASYPFGGRPKRAPTRMHRVAWLVSHSVVLTLCSPSPRARISDVSLGEARRLGASRPHAFTHVRSFPGLGVRRVLVGVEGFRPLGQAWMGWWFPPPRRSPPRSSGSPFTRSRTRPGAPGRDPGCEAAAVTSAVTAVLRSCPDGAVRTLTRPVAHWFVTPGA